MKSNRGFEEAIAPDRIGIGSGHLVVVLGWSIIPLLSKEGWLRINQMVPFLSQRSTGG
jgi:hypothetical protein